ncbi:hypothetical protein [Streptomyces sp. NPDC088246]|uniref:hypothetical protein n=1 Tax=Streptomyces sp. NPDC088246 TaxID=3365842 RepID=UPI00380E1DBB
MGEFENGDAGEDDRAGGGAQTAEALTEEERGDQRRDEDAGFTQGGDVARSPCACAQMTRP